jgi:processive 1,2-diacylglycerol beta-glucosyltransferase
MPRTLILTASYGSGHNLAARSLADGLTRAGAPPTVVDHFRELVHPGFERATRSLYYWMLRRAPLVWSWAYALGDRMPSGSPFTFGMPAVGTPGLARLLARLAPDVVVSVHATPAVAMARLADRGVAVPPHVTVVTDFVAHSQWIAPEVHRYCVAAEEVRDDFIARGIKPERIVVTGVPLRADFETDGDRLAIRRALGLDPEPPVVLVMAGAQGTFGHLPRIARTLVETPQPLQGVIITGTDPRVAAAVRRVTAGTRIRTFGWVDDVHRWMSAADVLVSKAGGMTLAEAMALEVPLLAYGSLPGQERRNETFAAAAGMALVARSPAELAAFLARVLAEPALRQRLRQRMRARRRPNATRDVVSVVLECATPLV